MKRPETDVQVCVGPNRNLNSYGGSDMADAANMAIPRQKATGVMQ